MTVSFSNSSKELCTCKGGLINSKVYWGNIGIMEKMATTKVYWGNWYNHLATRSSRALRALQQVVWKFFSAWVCSNRSPDPWEDLESRSPSRALRKYPIIRSTGTVMGVLLSRSSQGSGPTLTHFDVKCGARADAELLPEAFAFQGRLTFPKGPSTQYLDTYPKPALQLLLPKSPVPNNH